jgi:hypothetical protein
MENLKYKVCSVIETILHVSLESDIHNDTWQDEAPLRSFNDTSTMPSEAP